MGRSTQVDSNIKLIYNGNIYTSDTQESLCIPSVCTSTFNLMATWKILFEKGANHLFLNKMLDLWAFRDLVYMGEEY